MSLKIFFIIPYIFVNLTYYINAIFITSNTNITIYVRNPTQPNESVSDDTIAITCVADTVDTILNAFALDLAMGGSTNTVLHTIAATVEGKLSFDLSELNTLSKKTPYLCKVSPATPNVHMEDVLNAGGISAILKELSQKKGLLNLDRPTITGKTLGESIENAKNLNPKIIRSVDKPFSKEGGLAVLYGNIAPNGSVVKTGAVDEKMMVHEGPARIYDSQEDALNLITTTSPEITSPFKMPFKASS